MKWLYMKLYNSCGIIFCLYALICTVLHFKFHNDSYVLKIALCQSFFLLEIFNIITGKSNSSFIPTFLQLVSRMFIIWIVCYFQIDLTKGYSFTVMSLSWFFSDLIRYIYYLIRADWSKWLRYNSFILFYPIGTSIEIYLMNCLYLKSSDLISKLIAGIILCYIPGFAFLYFHMIKQRNFGKKNKLNKSL
ncbi:hypothetical protein GVAV_002731 [Gurleya vavrai]